MKKLYKAALLAALGLASVMAAQAQTTYNNGDLLVGVYNSSASQTYVLDLGQFSTAAVDGNIWNLSAALTSAGMWNSISGSLKAGTQFGVIGYSGTATGATGNGKYIYTTYDPALGTPATIGNKATFNLITPDILAIGQNAGLQANGTAYSWDTQTINGGFFGSSSINPNVAQGFAATFYADQANGSQAPLLDFNLSSAGVLSYGAVAVPEPSTYGLLAGAGLLIVSLRNKFSRKQA
jgi:hypothetical protein